MCDVYPSHLTKTRMLCVAENVCVCVCMCVFVRKQTSGRTSLSSRWWSRTSWRKTMNPRPELWLESLMLESSDALMKALPLCTVQGRRRRYRSSPAATTDPSLNETLDSSSYELVFMTVFSAVMDWVSLNVCWSAVKCQINQSVSHTVFLIPFNHHH